MEYSCYGFRTENEDQTFIFTKYQELLNIDFVIFILNDINDEIFEDKINFFIMFSDLTQFPRLNEYYKMSIILTKNKHKLVYNKYAVYPDYNWRILSRFNIDNHFTETYDYHSGFFEHPGVKFDKIKREGNIHILRNKLNIYSIQHYIRKYETKMSIKPGELYIAQELDKIEKDITIIEQEIVVNLINENIKIIGEALPNDITDVIEQMALANAK